ncbi:MAG TPA: YicC/YloC family endoribonuclease [Planctomycetaceae bacterium]|nr:YicC/YloC family endoribonuclease [Planctomycetaceae bacterium]
MTGFGDARAQDERLTVAIEVRSVNNRYLKISTRCPDAYGALEGDIEKLVRQSISRGTITVTLRVERHGGEQQYVLNREVVQQYWRQLSQVSEAIHAPAPASLANLLLLPGVVLERDGLLDDPHGEWPLIRGVLERALAKLGEFREIEGRSMESDLRTNSQIILERLDRVAVLAPQVVVAFRDRVLERVRELLQATDVGVSSADLIREVSIFSERCDINEEIMRLRSHLEQFATFLGEPVSQGRKLEFLSQEMFREVNTIGSKSNNVEISHAVVDMKAAVEKIREVLQNVE